MKKIISFILIILLLFVAGYYIKGTNNNQNQQITKTWIEQDNASFKCGDTIKVDGYIYNTIGGKSLNNKCWTSTNMKHMPASEKGSWNYGDKKPNLATNEAGKLSGRLYTWYSAMGLIEGSEDKIEDTTKSVCGKLGKGWHMPTFENWSKLINVGATGWEGRTDESGGNRVANKLNGIASKLGGYRSIIKDKSYFEGMDTVGEWWSSTSDEKQQKANAIKLMSESIEMIGDNIEKSSGVSVVCIKD